MVSRTFMNHVSEPSGNRSLMQWGGCLRGATEENVVVAKGCTVHEKRGVGT